MSDASDYHECAVEIRIPARPENLSVLRTLVGATGTCANLDVDTVADWCLAVDEACTQLIDAAVAGAELTVVVHPCGGAMTVRASVDRGSGEVLAAGSLSRHVLTALVDDVRVITDGAGPQVLLTKRRAIVT